MEDINSRAFNGKVKEGELVFKIRKNLCCCGRTNADHGKEKRISRHAKTFITCCMKFKLFYLYRGDRSRFLRDQETVNV